VVRLLLFAPILFSTGYGCSVVWRVCDRGQLIKRPHSGDNGQNDDQFLSDPADRSPLDERVKSVPAFPHESSIRPRQACGDILNIIGQTVEAFKWCSVLTPF